MGVDEGAAGLEVLVLRIQQIEQRALADVELLPVGVARHLGREVVLIEEAELLVQALDVVEGNRQRLAHVAASQLLQLARLGALLHRLALTRLIGAAPVQVVVQHHLGHGVARAAGHVVQVAAPALAQTKIDPRPERGLARLDLAAAGAHVLKSGVDGRAGGQTLAQCVGHGRGHARQI